MGASPRVLIIAGELSGDRYAEQLGITLRSRCPEIEIVGVGGSNLAKVADTLVYNTDNNHAMGFWEQFKQRGSQATLLTALADYLKSTPVSHAVIIDFQHMNTKIAAILRQYDIPITTFITPSFWIWNDQKGIRRIADYSHNIVTIFQKEQELYAAHHKRTYYFGHPVMQTYTPVVRDDDVLSRRPATIVLYPGSRLQEVHYHFPDMLKAAQLLQRQDPSLVVFVVSLSPALDVVIKEYLAKWPVAHLTVESSFSDRVLSSCTFVICVAGTTTLDLLLNRIPMISLGKVSYLTYLIGTYVFGIKLPYAALPNIMAGRSVVPDLTLKEVSPEAIFREALALLDPTTSQQLLEGYVPIINQLATGQDPFEETAQLILNDL